MCKTYVQNLSQIRPVVSELLWGHSWHMGSEAESSDKFQGPYVSSVIAIGPVVNFCYNYGESKEQVLVEVGTGMEQFRGI